MARTFLSQPEQIFSSEQYDDTQTVGQTMTGSANLEQDLNNIRTQLRQFLWANVSGSWYDAVQASSGPLALSGPRGINTLNTDLNDLEQKRFLYRTTNVNTVFVHSSSNVALLSVSLGTTPNSPIAIGDTIQTGSVVAELLGSGTFGSHSFELVSGTVSNLPRNLVTVRDVITGEIIQDVDGEDIYFRLKVER